MGLLEKYMTYHENTIRHFTKKDYTDYRKTLSMHIMLARGREKRKLLKKRKAVDLIIIGLSGR